MEKPKGPLKPYIGEECHGVLDADGRHILEFWNREGQDNVALAHLMAAAPELLEALKALDMCGDYAALIAKAEGRA